MDRKILLDATLPLHRLDDVLMCGFSRRGNPMEHHIDFTTRLGGGINLDPSQRLRLTLTAEPIVTDFLLPEDRALDVARERLRSSLVRLQYAGLWPIELDELATSIELLASARVGRALAIHCDADHDDDY